MAKTSIEKLLGDHLQGLILPVENSISAFTLLALLGVLLLILMAIFWRWKKHTKKPAQQAKKKLKRLQKNANDSHKATVLQLAKILRDGLEVPRLELFESTLKSEQANEWLVFQNKLELACYSSQAQNFDLNSLFKQANHWLENQKA